MDDSCVIGKKQVIVSGDRVLVSPSSPEERTRSGLYLPESAADGRRVSGGWVEAVGPGYPIPTRTESSEPWKPSSEPVRYIPLQVSKGDFVLYVSKSAWEIRLEGQKHFVVPNSAVLLILREEWQPAE
jgi:co-chaperonin GroES (HSP10)